MSEARATGGEGVFSPEPEADTQDSHAFGLRLHPPRTERGSDAASGTIELELAARREAIERMREVARQTTDAELRKLMEEHQALVFRKHGDQGLTRSEQLRLQLLRWEIQRVHDSRHGQGLDMMEALADAHERLLHHIQERVDQFSKLQRGSQRRS